MKLRGKQVEDFIKAINKSDEELIPYKSMNVEEIRAVYESKNAKRQFQTNII